MREMRDKAVCLLCFNAKNFTAGIVSVKQGNTSGLCRHYQNHHREEFDKFVSANKKLEASMSQKNTLANNFPVKPKEVFLGTDDIKRLFKSAGAIWAVSEAIPLSAFEKKSFRNMFKPFNKKADEITNVNYTAMREHVMEFGRFCKAATEVEMTDREMSWTTDHWTGPNNLTYSTLTAHWIDELWEIEACMLDFHVHRGRSTGEAIYHDIAAVLARFKSLSMVILDYLGVTDTTGNMGKLGAYCRENNRRHAYCTDHNFHRNAILAFNREC
jgi:hypothetical protein